MCEVLYTEKEGDFWKVARVDMSEEDLMKICEAQAKSCIDPYHRVGLTNGYKAAAIMFHNGTIWDAILSGYDSIGCRRTLPKCWPNRFDPAKEWIC